MRVMHGWAALLAVALLAAAGSHAMGLTLVKDGAPTSVIIIADPAPEAAKIGAQELQYHLKKMTGAEIPILTADQAPKDAGTALVLIGKSPLTDALGIDPSGLKPEGYMIKTQGNALILLGDEAKRPQKALEGELGDFHGSLLAVYGLLEDQLGCHWIWPGVTGEYIPKRSTVEFADLNIVDDPFLLRRHIRLVLNKGVGPSSNANLLGEAPLDQLKQDETVWYRRMRLGRSEQPPAGHSFTRWYERYKDTNPEVFALLDDGRRGPQNVNRPAYMKMCVANPKFWELQLKLFKDAHDKNPNHHELPCNENDGSSGFCTCELCKAWDATVNNLPQDLLNNLDDTLVKRLTPGKDGLPTTLSTRYAKWFNEMARRVREIDPEGYVTGYAYTRFRDIPVGVQKLEPNMIIGYVGFNGYPRTALQRANDRRDYLGWAHPGIKLYIRPNLPHYTGNGHPYNVARDAAEDFLFVMNHGTYMCDYDSMNGYWASWGPTFYVLSRMMWEGSTSNIEGILDEWYNAFGPAERQVRAYYDFWEKYMVWIKTAPAGQVRSSVPEIYTPEITAEARKLLDAAIAAAANADESVKTRIENIELGLRNTELSVKAETLAAKPQSDPENAAALKAALQELLALRREIAPRNVVNVYQMIDGEMGGGGYWKGSKLPWTLLADVKATEGPMLID